MKRRILVLVLALLLSAPAVGGAQDASLADVRAKGRLTVGVDARRPPLSFMGEDGEYEGFDVDMIYAVCDILGVELEVLPIAWEEKAQRLADGTVDCVMSGLMAGEDEEAFAYSYPYLENDQVFVVKADASFATLDDLAGALVGVQAASSALTALQADPPLEASLGGVLEFDDSLALLDEIGTGGVAVALVDAVVAAYYMMEDEAVDYRVLEESLDAGFYAIGLRVGDAALLDAINQALVDIAFNGVLEEISVEWFTADVTVVAAYVAMAEEH